MGFVLKSIESKARFSRGLAATISGGPPSYSLGGPFVVSVAAGSSDGPVAPAPPGDLVPVAPVVEGRLVPEGEVPRLSTRVQALRDEAVSEEHQLSHFSKISVTLAMRPNGLLGAFVANHGRSMNR